MAQSTFMKNSFRCLGCLSLLLLQISCVVTRAEGDRINESLKWLKQQNNATLASQKEEIAKLNAHISRLEENLSHSKSSDAKAQLSGERLVEDLQALKGQIEELKHDLSAASGRPLPIDKAQVVPKDSPVDRVTLFNQAKQLAAQKKYKESIGHYGEFIERFGDDKELLDQALFHRAENYTLLAAETRKAGTKKELYKNAILSFQQLLTRFPKSSLIEITLFKTGRTLEDMGYPSDAVVFYQEILEKHKSSEFVGPAKKRLRSINPSSAKKSK